MLRTLSLLLLSGLLVPTAFATSARIASLSANPGFLDESDFFVYPFALARVGEAGFLNYNGGFDGGVVWKDQGLFFDRDTVAYDLIGFGPEPDPLRFHVDECGMVVIPRGFVF